MKYLLIFTLFAFLIALVYRSLRPYIATARRMLGIVRDLRSMTTDTSSEPLRRTAQSQEKLVRCEVCHTWIPASRALKLSSANSSYCSHECLENSAARVRQRAGSRR